MTATGAPGGGGAAPQNVFMDQFSLEARTQRVWDINHALWFTLMGLGGECSWPGGSSTSPRASAPC